MARFKKSFNWKGLIAAILVCFIAVGSIAVITAIVKNDTKTVSGWTFSRGDIDKDGKKIDSDVAIVTKDFISCKGLRCEVDIDARITYDVYYYDADYNYLMARKGLIGTLDENFPLAKYARIVIRPEVPEGVDKDDFRIAFYEVNKYAKTLKITVDKKQKYAYDGIENLYDEENVVLNKSFNNIDGGTTTSELIGNNLILTDNNSQKVMHKVAVSKDTDYFDIYIRIPENAGSISSTALVCLTVDDLIVMRDIEYFDTVNRGEYLKLSIDLSECVDYDLPEEDCYLSVRIPLACDSCYIFACED